MLFFQLGIYSVDLYDSRWLVSSQIRCTCMIKIQTKIFSNAFKNIVLKDHLSRSYDVGAVKFKIMTFI